MLARSLSLLALLVSQPALAGSGTVSFNFTSFSGPFANTSAGLDPSDPTYYYNTGTVNGALPTYTGVQPGASGLDVFGTAPLSGQTTTFTYTLASFALDNIVSFTPQSFDNVLAGQDFVLGKIAFTNGRWTGGSSNPMLNHPVDLNFTLSTQSSTAAFNQTITGAIRVITNQRSVGTGCDTLAGQQDEADFLTVSSGANIGSFGSLRVYDQFCKEASASNQGTIDLIGHFGSLDLVGLANPGGSGFYVPNANIGPITSVPEPATWAFMIFGFAAIAGMMRRRTITSIFGERKRQPA